MKQTKKWAFSFIALLVLGLVSCTKNSAVNNLSNADTRIYITQRDSTVNFSNYKTFSINDSVTVINNGQSSKSLTPTGQAFIDAISKYMQQAGYTLVSNTSNPDLGINVTYINTTTTGIIDYTDYYDLYSGYYDPTFWGYGGYGYYSPYIYGVYQINSGALSIDMLDLKNAAANGKIKIIWNGLIRGEGIADATTADSQVQALFSQSPYIKAN